MRMPFCLSNAGSRFCHLMEMCLRDQQFVTLLLYINSICTLLPMSMKCLTRWKCFYNGYKIQSKDQAEKCHFFQCSIVFLGYVLSAEGISTILGKVDKVKNWPEPASEKELHSFLVLAFYCRHLFLTLLQKQNVSISCWVQPILKKR